MRHFLPRMALAAAFALVLGSSSLALGQAAAHGSVDAWVKDIDEDVFRQNPNSNLSLIAAIRDRGDYFRDKTVELSGAMARRIQSTGLSHDVYYDFQDGYGESIRLKIDTRRPQESSLLARQGSSVLIRGVVGTENGMPLLTQPRLGPPWGPIAETPPLPSPPYFLYGLLGAAGVVLIVILVLAVFLMRKGSAAPATAGVALGGAMGATQRGAGDFGATTKVDLTQKVAPVRSTVISSTKRSVIPEPDATTIKMLPGYFSILSGTAQGKRLHIFAALTTIGRLETANDGRGLNHIGFDPSEKAVSRQQAELRYISQRNQFVLRNVADPVTKNATIINGREMKSDEDVALSDGDKVQFGPIELEFHTISSGS